MTTELPPLHEHFQRRLCDAAFEVGCREEGPAERLLRKEQLRFVGGGDTLSVHLGPSVTVHLVDRGPRPVLCSAHGAGPRLDVALCVHHRAALIATFAALVRGRLAARNLPLAALMGKRDLRRWAREHGLSAELERGTWELFDDVRAAGHFLLLDAVCDGRRRAPLVLRWELLDYLREVYDARVDAIDLVAARAHRQPPTHPRLRKAWELVEGRRASLRSRGNLRPYRMVVGVEPPSLRMAFSDEHACDAHYTSRLRVLVSFELERQRLELRSDCGWSGSHDCPARVSALEMVLDILSGLDPCDDADALRTALTQTDWQRTLTELGQLGGGAAHGVWDGPEVRVGWQLSPGPRVQALLVRPKKSGRGLVFKKLSWKTLRGLREERLAPVGPKLLALAPLLESARHSGQETSLHLLAVEELVGREGVFSKGGRRDWRPLRVERGRLELAMTTVEGGGATGTPTLDGTELDAEEVESLLRRGQVFRLDREAGRALLARASTRLQEAVRTLRRRTGYFPDEALPALLKEMPRLSRGLPLAVGPDLRGTRIAHDAGLRLRLERGPEGSLALSLRVRPLEEWGSFAPGDGPPILYAQRGDETVHAARDLAAETAAAAALEAELGLPASGEREGPGQWLLAPGEGALGVVAALRERPELPAEWGKGRFVMSRPAQASDLVVRPRARDHWFRLEGGVEVDGLQVPLSALLRAVREGRRFVAVDEDRWLQIGDALRTSLAPTAALAAERRGAVEVSRYAAPAVDALEAEGARLDCAGAWSELRASVRAAVDFEPEPPAGLEAELYDYQRRGYRWLARLARWGAGACLADDMGLGKTLQALTLLLARAAAGVALVVAPTSVVYNWVRECRRFTPGLTPEVFRGKRDLATLRAEPRGAGALLVTSYDLVARYREAFEELSFASLVLDEAQAIKNPQTRRARAIFALRAEVRIALTGTPVENRCRELWSIFRAIAPGLLGTRDQFQERFERAIEGNRDPARRALLAQTVRPFILRRMKSEVASDLPPRTDVRIDVTLSKAERAVYESFRGAALDSLAGLDPGAAQNTQRFQILAALTRLRQIACAASLVKPGAALPSSKLESLVRLLHELRDEGHRALVFSQFTRFLRMVEARLADEGFACRYLDGTTPRARRRREIDAFQAGEGDVFLLSVQAGGKGINLTAADYVIHLDPWWNPAVEDQASDRAHRIGQERPVTVCRMVSLGTVEERILELHAEKRQLVEALLDGSRHAGGLSSEQLLALIAESSAAALDLALESGDSSSRLKALPARAPEAEATARGSSDAGPASHAPAEVRVEEGPAPSVTSPVDRAQTPSPETGAEAPSSAVNPAGKAPTAATRAEEAPALPSTGARSPSPSPAAPAPPLSTAALLTRLEERLRQASANGRLSASTVKPYVRAARHILAFGAARGLSLAREHVEGTCRSFRSELESGRWKAPKSYANLAGPVSTWLALAAESLTAPAAENVRP